MNDLSPGSLVPPRPNLGPEPWSAPRTDPVILLGWGIGLAALIVLGTVFARRLAKRRLDVRKLNIDFASEEAEEALLETAGLVKDRLAHRFGGVIRAKTTEELAVDEALIGALGQATHAKIIELLRKADHWKFAPTAEIGNGQYLGPSSTS